MEIFLFERMEVYVLNNRRNRIETVCSPRTNALTSYACKFKHVCDEIFSK